MAIETMPATKGVVMLGATSAIARAVANEFAYRGYNLVLAARDQEENEIIAADLRVRWGASVAALPFEAENYDSHPAFFESCHHILGDAMEGVVLCFGYLAEQAAAQTDPALARRTIDVNYTSAVSILDIFARHFEQRPPGTPISRSASSSPFICGVSSVAGDRGRQSNYLYGSAKAGFSAYLAGLRNRLFHSGVHVITIKPGFIDTKMTFGKPGMILLAPASKAGKDIFNAIRRRKNVAYVPWFWRYIMVIIRHIPEWQFKRMKM